MKQTKEEIDREFEKANLDVWIYGSGSVLLVDGVYRHISTEDMWITPTITKKKAPGVVS